MLTIGGTSPEPLASAAALRPIGQAARGAEAQRFVDQRNIYSHLRRDCCFAPSAHLMDTAFKEPLLTSSSDRDRCEGGPQSDGHCRPGLSLDPPIWWLGEVGRCGWVRSIAVLVWCRFWGVLKHGFVRVGLSALVGGWVRQATV